MYFALVFYWFENYEIFVHNLFIFLFITVDIEKKLIYIDIAR
ncbi:hypothetical protein SAMN02745111_02397 [Eubacterium uniforme]|uniref:Uncharacterized protein n=1 Tax=Eubacterium uniforme TaxID=39495 RepID=A0A1T4W7J2_9FIRM|nr:hypothetical protein SAMN02745111_02397 [Eubacterium uniforme]